MPAEVRGPGARGARVLESGGLGSFRSACAERGWQKPCPASRFRRKCGVSRRIAATLLALFALLPSSSARGQASYGQYLVVIDDSGSMEENDPRRLAVMASLALAAGLEDGDQVMLVGLNELAGDRALEPAFVSPRELLAGRDGAEGPREIAGPRPERLGRRAGQTPCAEALAGARRILESVASAGAPQTLLMLTDGACNGDSVMEAEAWLGGLRTHREGRFRFVLLMREGRERLDRHLAEYSRRTGWRGEARISFDARSLLRAFAEVLSFSRGLRYDEGGRVGLERTFAGARRVRALAIRERGEGALRLERLGLEGAATPLEGGPTFRHPRHGWSLRVATATPAEEPFAIRSATSGAEVLVIPTYGQLRIDAILGSCEEPPALPWSEEQSVPAGQPVCAWARLIGDAAESIEPGRSFDFRIDLCAAEGCEEGTAMQPGEAGIFHAQIGSEFPVGRHERSFRATGGSLAFPVVGRRGFASVTYGIRELSLASAPETPLERLELGALPRASDEDTRLRITGSFPAGARARLSCAVEGDQGLAECLICELADEEIPLQDGLPVQVRVGASPLCGAVSDLGAEVEARLRLHFEPVGEARTTLSPYDFPMQATLRYAPSEPIEVHVRGGAEADVEVRVPAPIAPMPLEVSARLPGVQGLSLSAEVGAERVQAEADGRAAITLRAIAEDCCAPGVHQGQLILQAGGASQELPLRVIVEDPGFWICPGQLLLKIALGLLLLALLLWLLHGWLAPARFREGAVILYASSHDTILELREGDDGFRKLRRFREARRGFRRHAALHLGGRRAPLPSLRRMPADGRIEARRGGGATLIVTGPGIERFRDSDGWTELEPGEYPVSNNILLRRGEEVYIQFRR